MKGGSLFSTAILFLLGFVLGHRVIIPWLCAHGLFP